MPVAPVIAAVAAVAGTAYSVYSGERAADQAKDAQKEARMRADQQAEQAEQDLNAANKKRPNTNAMLDDAAQAGKAGASGTMLTGAQGVDPSTLALGKNTLLGS